MEQAIKQIIVTSPMGNEIDPVVEVQKNGEADDNAIIYADLKDNIYTVDMDENLVIGDDAYTVIIDYPGLRSHRGRYPQIYRRPGKR